MAVVGNVGTYAQVQPVQTPDFGGMVQNQFDKLDAEKKGREAAKAKAEKDRMEQIEKVGSIGDLQSTNIEGVNYALNNSYKNMVNEYAEASNNGDTFKMRKLQDSLKTMNNSTKMVNDRMAFLERERDNLDEDFYNRNMDILNNLNAGNMDINYKGNGDYSVTIYEDETKKTPILKDVSPNGLVGTLTAPYKFDLEATVKDFTDNYKLSSIETILKDNMSTVTTEDIMKNPNINNAIDAKANELSNSGNSLANWGKTKGIFKTSSGDFTKEEKQEAFQYFKDRLTNSYRDKIDYDLKQKSTSGGSGKDGYRIGSITNYEAPSIKIEDASTATGKEIKLEDTGSVVRAITNSSGTGLKVGNMSLDRVLYNPKDGKMYVSKSYSMSGSTSVRGVNTGASAGESDKTPKWYSQNSDEFNQLKASLNSSFNLDLKTLDDVKKYLFNANPNI
jgi:hypothetical protein